MKQSAQKKDESTVLGNYVHDLLDGAFRSATEEVAETLKKEAKTLPPVTLPPVIQPTPEIEVDATEYNKTDLIQKVIREHQDLQSSEDIHVESDMPERDFFPDYSYQRFDALFYQIGQFSLVSPLSAIRYVIDEAHVHNTGSKRQNWHRGSFFSRGVDYKVIDVMYWLRKQQGLPEEDTPVKHICLTNNYSLVCSQVQRVTQINPKDVNWNNKMGEPGVWRVGTLKEELISIVDLEQLCSCISN